MKKEKINNVVIYTSAFWKRVYILKKNGCDTLEGMFEINRGRIRYE